MTRELHLLNMDLSSILENSSSCESIQNIQIDMMEEQKFGIIESIPLSYNINMIKEISINATGKGTGTMDCENLSNLVFAVMNDEDASKEFTFAMKKLSENKLINTADMNNRCEFSLHEVLSGCAKVPRLNGEQPKVCSYHKTFDCLLMILYFY